MDIKDVCDGLRYLSAYRHLLERPVLKNFWHMLAFVNAGQGSETVTACLNFFCALKSEGYRSLGDWLWDELRFSESPYGLLKEMGGEDPELERAAKQDIDALVAASRFSRPQFLASFPPSLAEEIDPERLPWWQAGPPPFDFDILSAFYQENGCGLFARYRAFRWREGRLIGIDQPDSPQPWELWGYEEQRQQVRTNALALVEGRWVNHVLLYGESGTGKSATVKSLLAQPGLEPLRIIELDKGHLEDIPALVRMLEHRAQKFILFIDDLAFDADDKAYSQLKTILEGSLEKQRDNVVVYATSNRRNLVKQNFSDRDGDELDRNETIAEKTSLADRFGVRVAYFALTPREFWQMVEELAKVYGLKLEHEELLHRAEQWELRHPGRTPRVARQFIAYELDRQK